MENSSSESRGPTIRYSSPTSKTRTTLTMMTNDLLITDIVCQRPRRRNLERSRRLNITTYSSPSGWKQVVSRGQIEDEPNDYLNGVQEIENYLDAIGEEIPPKNAANLGIFWLPYEQHQRLFQLLNPGSTKKERACGNRKNEELVNASLVNFLQAVCAKHRNVDSDWNPARVKLTFDFMKVKMDKEIGELGSDVFSLSCQVDGFLESRSTFRTQAILEAKALGRTSYEPKVSC
ncbi:hypothetical protein N7461_004208 [Penicillium sp. DV-2018c]|nr:hypothetical protein N7461_004208 [Penicillium sp. DV-2018c]